MVNGKRVCIFISEEAIEKIKKIAASEHRSVSNLIEVWIAEHDEA